MDSLSDLGGIELTGTYGSCKWGTPKFQSSAIICTNVDMSILGYSMSYPYPMSGQPTVYNTTVCILLRGLSLWMIDIHDPTSFSEASCFWHAELGCSLGMMWCQRVECGSLGALHESWWMNQGLYGQTWYDDTVCFIHWPWLWTTGSFCNASAL